ncbi:MAG: hypothetical protein V8R60_08535 [Faecalibacterium sp.]
MKLKKFFAGVLAAAMMLTVGATAAFAKREGNKVDASYVGSWQIQCEDVCAG